MECFQISVKYEESSKQTQKLKESLNTFSDLQHGISTCLKVLVEISEYFLRVL